MMPWCRKPPYRPGPSGSWYWNSILKTWNAKGLRTVHDVRGPVAGMGASRNLRVDRAEPSGNDFLKNAARRRPLRKKTDTPAE